jgi:hypothetical protein
MMRSVGGQVRNEKGGQAPFFVSNLSPYHQGHPNQLVLFLSCWPIGSAG